MNVAQALEGKRVCICGGSGGVGKTTVAAAIAMGAAAEGKKVAVVTIDPARRLADSLGLEELDNEPRLVDVRAVRGCGSGDARRAVGDDARPQAHVRRGDRAARARREDARRRAGKPHLPAALERRCGLAGVHRDRQALRARPRVRLRPARARHAAVAQCAGLPRRARPPDPVLRGPRAAGLPAPDRAGRARDGPRHRHGVRRAQAGHGRRPARGPVGLLPRHRRHDRRLQGARACRSTSCSPTRGRCSCS